MMNPTRPSLRTLLLVPGIFISIFHALPTAAYIPAVAINDTPTLNMTDSSSITITWVQPVGVYSGRVSFQLRADVPTGGTTEGALVHFTEASAGPNLTTSTPWIAYISCDINETMASEEDDIFTLARDRGAVSALLYTATSQSCLLNQEYIQDFEKPLDVFATETGQVARLIDSKFVHANDTSFFYSGTLLNASGTAVNASIAGNPPNSLAFLIGTLTARNSSGQAVTTTVPGPTATPVPTTGKKPASSMIALYVITGVISALFILMVFIGARRALRHPERYGRREATDQQGPQTRAGGIAQAILDTFPVIKFNRSHSQFDGASPKRLSSERDANSAMYSDVNNRHTLAHSSEGTRESVALRSLRTEASSSRHSPIYEDQDDVSVKSVEQRTSRSIPTPSGSRRTSNYDGTHQTTMEEDVTQDQCPICLVDFEEGDDLRVLPCEKEHVYHKACIDPWLLQVSSSCPLCRKDFNNPRPPSLHEAPLPSPSSTSQSNQQAQHPPTTSGFPKYLAFMRRQRGVRRERANTTESGVGAGRRREADQTGPGGY